MSKIKELDKRATIAWSAAAQYSDLIVAGTAAGTIGLDFDTSSQLEIYSLDIKNASTDLALVGKATSHNRFHKLVWGQAIGSDRTHGIIAGGMDNGSVTLWDPAKIIAGKDEEANLGSAQKHQGAVQALDFNPYQHNLLASGATDSEIFIWDLSNPSNPTVYTPGTKPQQTSDVSCVAWNKKVPHILASATHSGVTFIWDLKAKRSIINFVDPAKSQVRSIAWNPQEATQVLTASEDDASPVLQLWDLRNIYTPVRKYSGHTRGIWGVSWCPFDNSLIVSCGKDNRTLCWNADTAEVLCEVESGSADSGVWNVDVQWSPRTPAVLSTSSLEGKVSVYALQDVSERNVTVQNDLGITAPPTRPTFRHTPSWLRRPAGVSFGFGGKLASFSYNPTTKKSSVKVRKVVTEKELLDRSERLEEVVSSGSFEAFCDEKIATSTAEGEEKYTWRFLKVLFDKEGRHKILDYLGFDEAQAAQELHDIKATLPLSELEQEAVEEPVAVTEEKIPSPVPSPKHEEEPAVVPATPETEGEQGESKDVAGLFGAGADAFSFSLPEKTEESQQVETKKEKPTATPTPQPARPRRNLQPIQLSTSGMSPESAITKALLVGNFAGAVELCVRLDRLADALVLAACGGEELWTKTQERYFASQKSPYARLMSSIVRNDLQELVEQADLADWKATLAILCTYAKGSELPKLATVLGDRLDTEAHNTKAATLCYICAGSIDKTVSVWIRTTKEHKDPHQALQDLIEKVSIFRHAVNASDNDLDELLARKYSEYAEILASQGRLPASFRYLSFLSDPKYNHTGGAVLLDRVYNSFRPTGITPPPFPFNRQEVGIYHTTPLVAPQQQVQQQAHQHVHHQHGAHQQHVHQPPQQTPFQQGPFPPQAHVHQQPQPPHFQQGIQQPFGQPQTQQLPPVGGVNVFNPGAVSQQTAAPPPMGTGYAGAPPPQFPPPAHGHQGHAHQPGHGHVHNQPPVQPPPPVGFSGQPLNPVGPPPTGYPPTQYGAPPPQGGALPPQVLQPLQQQAPPQGLGAPPPAVQQQVAPPPTSVLPPSVPFQTKENVGNSASPPVMANAHMQPRTPPTNTPTQAASGNPPQPAGPSANANPDVRFIADALNRSLATPLQGPNKAKWDDMSKRLPPLVSALEKGTYKDDAVQLLSKICKASESGDHETSSKVLQELGTSNLVPAKELIGIKRYVELSRAR